MTTTAPFSRLVLAGLSGDAGKTLVSLGVALAVRGRGIDVAAFKRGPDFIDTAWLSCACGRPARNLDTWMAGFERVVESFHHHASPAGFNLVEGSRGLYDGVDVEGTHSTAELAKALQARVVLVVDARKATRTLAACVLGCQMFDPEARIAGVILNRIVGGRHLDVARRAVETRCRIPVVGAIPRLPEGELLPARHLGLVTPEEHPAREQVWQTALTVARHLDIDALLRIAADAPALPREESPSSFSLVPNDRMGARISGDRPRVGYLRDSAFSFYYPENLEALEAAGAFLVPVSSLSGDALPPDLDALYIGGGFPETHAAALASNRALLDSLARMAAAGLPVYAECGGLMLLSRTLSYRGDRHRMAGVLPVEVEVHERPQGHGYAWLSVDGDNPFFTPGTVLTGHEFHYSRIAGTAENNAVLRDMTACAVHRGTGCGGGRDALVVHNVWASYAHLHALGTPEWAPAMVRAARRYRDQARVTHEIQL